MEPTTELNSPSLLGCNQIRRPKKAAVGPRGLLPNSISFLIFLNKNKRFYLFIFKYLIKNFNSFSIYILNYFKNG